MQEERISLEKTLSNNEIEVLEKIGIKIRGETYTKEKIIEICKVSKEKYLDVNISYEEANKYYDLFNRFGKLDKVDLKKVCEHSKEEFENDIYIETQIFHAVRWSNPEMAKKNHLKNTGEEMSDEEYNMYKIRNEKAEKNMEKYYKYMEEKYGDLDSARAWYNVWF